jgi:16S rRNA (cytidine1402-2'-O)-methyltransferase
MKEPNFDEKNKIEKGTLYLVATPIGNLADISYRALKVLDGVDFVAAEDTRNSAKLLTFFGISKPLVSYFEHNKRERGLVILERLKNGESCALVTDAGTPAISDPGEDLVVLCAENNVPVTSIPGCSAVVNALALSALPTGRFCFEGFLSTNKNERLERLNELKNDTRTTIFYEAPHKLIKTLEDLLSVFENRRISLCRELTKLNEEIKRTTLGEAVVFYNANEPRGEFVLIIEGFSGKVVDDGLAELLALTPEEHVDRYVAEGMSKMDATKRAAKDRGMSKSKLYKILNS